MLYTSDLDKGTIIKLNNKIYQITQIQSFHLGRGGGYTRVTLKNLESGETIKQTFKSGQKFEDVDLEYKEASYLYHDRNSGVFLDNNKQRISVPLSVIESKIPYLVQNSVVQLAYCDNKLIGIKLPPKVDLKVTQSPTFIKGNTAAPTGKTVTLETGLKINVPVFINQGDVIRINTETGKYTERVTKAK